MNVAEQMIKLMHEVCVERLAKHLHEAGREAVEKGAVVNKTPGRFLEWYEITEEAREGRRIQARYLFEHFDITEREKPKE